MTTREATRSDLERWIEFRHELWPDSSIDALRSEALAVLDSPEQTCFLVFDDPKTAVGFAEVAIHPSPSGPYGHLEGWYVVPAHRGKGMGRELVGCVEQWCLHRAICKLTSDTYVNYPLSHEAHARAGFKKIHEFTIFAKDLQ